MLSLTINLTDLNVVAAYCNAIEAGIKAAKKELLKLEQHPYMGVPVVDEAHTPEETTKIETLHSEISYLRKLRRDIDDVILVDWE